MYRGNLTTAERLLDELKNLIRIFPEWDRKPNEWLIANPAKDIMAFSHLEISTEALEYLRDTILKRKSVSIVLAGEEKDDSPVIIWFHNTPAVSVDRYSLTIAIRSPQDFNDRHAFQKIIEDMSMLTQWSYSFISLETEQYRMKQRSVFEDRLAAGWMLLLPKEISSEEVPSAADVINYPETKSTLIITKDKFDGNSDADITCANNVEIELAGNGFLPKWFDL